MTDLLDELVDQLCLVGKEAVQNGLVLATGGNISARLPDSDVFVVTGSGTYLDKLTRESFARMDLSGNIVTGFTRPSSEWKLHQRTYIARPDVNSVIHVHPQHAVLLDALGYRVRLFTLDHAHYVRSVGRTPYYPNGSDELADSSAQQSIEHNCIIQGYHGCSAIGQDIDMAFRRALNLEQAAEATFRALQLGDEGSQFPAAELERLQHA